MIVKSRLYKDHKILISYDQDHIPDYYLRHAPNYIIEGDRRIILKERGNTNLPEINELPPVEVLRELFSVPLGVGFVGHMESMGYFVSDHMSYNDMILAALDSSFEEGRFDRKKEILAALNIPVNIGQEYGSVQSEWFRWIAWGPEAGGDGVMQDFKILSEEFFGCVYAYNVKDGDGDHVSGCGGFVGHYESAIQEAKVDIDAQLEFIEQRTETLRELLPQLAIVDAKLTDECSAFLFGETRGLDDLLMAAHEALRDK